jgi:uncharacterized protein YbaP (TraB family)
MPIKFITCLLTCLLSSSVLFSQKVKKTLKNKQPESGILWRISGNGLSKPSYMFGTFHLAVKPSKEVLDSCRKYIKTVGLFYGELDLSVSEMDPSRLMDLGSMGHAGELSQLYQPEDWTYLRNFLLDSVRMEEEVFRHMKPMMVSMMISIYQLSHMAGMDDINYSLDRELQNMARNMGKPVSGLETVQEQGEIMFNRIPLQIQADYLLQCIRSGQFNEASTKALTRLYKSGNVAALSDTIHQGMSGMFEDIFLKQRNEHWLDVMLGQFKNQKRLFVAVGAGHLGGRHGMINLLRKAGYQVVPVL